MRRCKLRDCVNTEVFEIIDDWTHQHIATLKYDDAIEKYGECEVEGTYTEAWVEYGWRTSVWLNIPGMKLCGSGNQRLNIYDRNGDEATFRGKKTGQLITVTKYGEDDYSAWWHDSENSAETEGCSVRGTMWQIMDEMEGEF